MIKRHATTTENEVALNGDAADAEQVPVTNKVSDKFDVLAQIRSTEPYNGQMSMTLLILAFKLCKLNYGRKINIEAFGTITYNEYTLL